VFSPYSSQKYKKIRSWKLFIEGIWLQQPIIISGSLLQRGHSKNNVLLFDLDCTDEELLESYFFVFL
jgi:hypothetical protein